MPLDIGTTVGGSSAYVSLRPLSEVARVTRDSDVPTGAKTAEASRAGAFRFAGPLTGSTAITAQAQGGTVREPAPGTGAGGRPGGAAGPAGTSDGLGKSGKAEEAKEAKEAKEAEEDSGSGDPTELTEEEQESVDELKARDAEVRRHEQAHAAVGGQYAGSPRYDYTQGPDGNSYATGGEVSIDASPVPDDPQATILKMQIVKAAALAPAEPSAQDRKVASAADQARAKAQAELSRQSLEELGGEGEDGETDGVAPARNEENRESGAATGGAGPVTGLAGLFSRGGGDSGRARGSLLDASL